MPCLVSCGRSPGALPPELSVLMQKKWPVGHTPKQHSGHANRSFTRGSAISNSFEMEALLYAAGTRQCSAAVAFGLHEGENHLYICCCPTRPGIWDELAGSVHFLDEPDDGISPQKAARLAALFGISPIELDAAGEDRIRDLVLERVALLNVSK